MATRITIGKRIVRGEVRWVVSRREAGRRKRTFHKTKAEAEAEASTLREQQGAAGHVWLSLTARERQELIQAYSDAKARSINLRELIAAAPTSGATTKRSLEVVINELTDAKSGAGRSKPYVASLKGILTQFAKGRESVGIAEITLADVEAFLGTKQPHSRPTHRARLSTLFKFSIRRGYRHDNPCSRLETVTLKKTPPRVFTTGEFAKAVKWLRLHAPHALGWLALSTLCGLRPQEAEKTSPVRDVNMSESLVRVEAQTTKVGQRRVVYPRPEAMRFLKSVLKSSRLPLPSKTRKRALRQLRTHLGWTAWPKDITRHTAASYWLAGGATLSHVAEMLGHSERILKRDYKALVTRSEADEFWQTVVRLIGKNNQERTIRRRA